MAPLPNHLRTRVFIKLTLISRVMRNKKIIMAGGTGFIGQALAARWGKDNHVVILSRQGGSRTGHPKTEGRLRSGGATGPTEGAGPNNAYKRKLLSAEDGYNITYWRWDGRHVE